MKAVKALIGASVAMSLLVSSAACNQEVLAESSRSSLKRAETLINWIHSKPKGFVSSKVSLKEGPEDKAVHS
jgi:hypothetical protein